jgi:ubiquinone/menaquinone biosynthesis C-methylase UbiE
MNDNPQQPIKAAFDAVADGYDTRALRFFADGAAHLAARLPLRGDEAVLDVACGTGHASLAIAAKAERDLARWQAMREGHGLYAGVVKRRVL